MKKLFLYVLIGMGALTISCGGDGKGNVNCTDTDSVDVMSGNEINTDSLEELAVFQAKAVEFIRGFYDEFVLGGGEVTAHVAESYFTPILEKSLSELYDYDGEGYAVWEFRTGAQDGPSKVSKVISIMPQNRHEYLVTYRDMGLTGQTLVTISEQKSQIQISKVSRKK